LGNNLWGIQQNSMDPGLRRDDDGKLIGSWVTGWISACAKMTLERLSVLG